MEVQGGKPLVIIGTVSLVLMGILYIAQVNDAATKGYAVKSLHTKNVALQQECDRLDIQIARLRSIDSVKTREAFLGLRVIAPAAFVRADANMVAVR